MSFENDWKQLMKMIIGVVSTIAGSKGGMEDGEFNGPIGITIDNQGCIIIADSSNHRIRKIS